MQIIDAMWKPSAYDWVYPLSYLFTFSIATPHSILVQLAYPKGNLLQGEFQPRACAICAAPRHAVHNGRRCVPCVLFCLPLRPIHSRTAAFKGDHQGVH